MDGASGEGTKFLVNYYLLHVVGDAYESTPFALRLFYGAGIMCVWVFFPFILDVKFVGCTRRGHTGFLIPLPSAVHSFIFLEGKFQPFLSLLDREVEFGVLTIYSFSTCSGI